MHQWLSKAQIILVWDSHLIAELRTNGNASGLSPKLIRQAFITDGLLSGITKDSTTCLWWEIMTALERAEVAGRFRPPVSVGISVTQ